MHDIWSTCGELARCLAFGNDISTSSLQFRTHRTFQRIRPLRVSIFTARRNAGIPSAVLATAIPSVGPSANLKGPYFSRVCVSACMCVCLCVCVFYPSTLTDFHETWSQGPYCGLVSPRPWSRPAAEEPRDAFLKISKNSQKSQNSNFRILVHHFLGLCLLCVVKKFDSIRTKLTEEIHFEICPYGDSDNGIAAAARRSPGYCN